MSAMLQPDEPGWDQPDEPVTTPFEDWCEAHGLHPEDPNAWNSFTWAKAHPVS
jgi:hypothetical protein